MGKRVLFSLVITALVFATFPSAVIGQDDGIPPEIEKLAFQGVETNDDWQPYTREIDGVEMVLVPAGCFMMGSSDEQVEYVSSFSGVSLEMFSDEQPAHQQCFDQPFWIDKYEITNGQFAQFAGEAIWEVSNWPDETRPRNLINWFEARDFCETRGARLPTEAEWEYAARGPDNLIFPWGDTFVSENVVVANPGGTTDEVGSIPGGVSWVGTLDMSGNVIEWTSSVYEAYPYDATDGREDRDVGSWRVARGGSFWQGNVEARTVDRKKLSTYQVYWILGARCVRPFEVQ